MAQHSFGVCDLETTIRLSCKRKANPFDPENWTVNAGVEYADEEWGTDWYFTSAEESRAHPWFRDMLASTKLLVGFNFKFDIHHAICSSPENYRAWMQWVADGGMIWDCQLAEYLLDGMHHQAQYLSLDEVAPRYGGNVKVDEVKAMWEAGIDTPDIPEDLLRRYLVGNRETGELGDLGNTKAIFKGQLRRAREHGQMKSILLNMGSLLYTIEAEYNGMAVDLDLGIEIAHSLEEELTELGKKLVTHLPEDLPFEFKWGSRHHLSALIFGGTIKYVDKAVVTGEDGEPVYFQRKVKHVLLEDPDLGSMPLDEWEAEDPDERPAAIRAKSGKSKGEPKTKVITGPDLERGPKTRNEDFFYTFEGFTEPADEWKTKTDGVWSVSGDVIDALGNRDIPFLNDLSRHALLSKDLNTYFITDDPKTGGKKGMLTLVDNGFIHHKLNHTSTVTGRFSSSDPNLQNLSGKDKSRVKELFVSRYKGGKVIQSDFTSLEIYIQAVLTECPQMIDDLRAGLDMHCLRVSQAERVPYEEAVEKCKEQEVPEWVSKRKKAKAFSFQRAYGAGVAKIALSTGMDEEEVQKLADAENERYPEVEQFYARITETIESSAVSRGIQVPHPNWPAKQVPLRRGFYRTPDNKLYVYDDNPAPKFVVERSGQWSSFSPPEIKNYVVQGTGAEWAKAAMWLAIRAFYRTENFGGRACLTNQVHDACYADAAPEVAPEAAALIHAAMEHASPFIEQYFGWDQPVYVPSDTTWGDSMIEEYKPEGMADHLEWANDAIKAIYEE